jgi:hypothetical protein
MSLAAWFCLQSVIAISNVAEHLLWNTYDIRAAVSEELRIITETGLHFFKYNIRYIQMYYIGLYTTKELPIFLANA